MAGCMRNIKIAALSTLLSVVLLVTMSWAFIRPALTDYLVEVILGPTLQSEIETTNDLTLQESVQGSKVTGNDHSEKVFTGLGARPGVKVVDSTPVIEKVEPKSRIRDGLPKFQKELKEYQAINPEVVGWLNIPNTNMSFPLPLNSSRKASDGSLDNSYYLNHTVDLKFAPDGDEQSAVFVDSRNKMNSIESMSQNTVIYGHNWTNVESRGSQLKVASVNDKMFAQLPSFANLEFAKKNIYFTIDLNGEQAVYMIFAAMYVDTWNTDNPRGFYYIDTDTNSKTFTELISEARDRSEHLYKVPIGVGDKIVTLTTCTLKYGPNPNQRFVVMGRLLRDNEDISDFEEPIANPLPKRPNV